MHDRHQAWCTTSHSMQDLTCRAQRTLGAHRPRALPPCLTGDALLPLRRRHIALHTVPPGAGRQPVHAPVPLPRRVIHDWPHNIIATASQARRALLARVDVRPQDVLRLDVALQALLCVMGPCLVGGLELIASGAAGDTIQPCDIVLHPRAGDGGATGGCGGFGRT